MNGNKIMIIIEIMLAVLVLILVVFATSWDDCGGWHIPFKSNIVETHYIDNGVKYLCADGKIKSFVKECLKYSYFNSSECIDRSYVWSLKD